MEKPWNAVVPMSRIMGSSLFGFPVKLGINIPAPHCAFPTLSHGSELRSTGKRVKTFARILLKLCRVMFDQIFVVFMISWQIFKIQIASLRVDLHKIWSFVFQLFQLDISPIVAIFLLGASFLDKSRRGFYCRADADFLASINAAARRCRLRAWRWMDGWDLAWLAMIYQPVNMPKYMWKTTPYPSFADRFPHGNQGVFQIFLIFCMFTRRYERENVKQ